MSYLKNEMIIVILTLKIVLIVGYIFHSNVYGIEEIEEDDCYASKKERVCSRCEGQGRALDEFGFLELGYLDKKCPKCKGSGERRYC